LTEYSQTDGSPAEALSNQRTGWCCIDRLSWQRLPGMWIISEWHVIRAQSPGPRSKPYLPELHHLYWN
jgi:hypothetical protein